MLNSNDSVTCCICGCTEGETSHMYKKSKYTDGKPVCNKHYKQLSRYDKILERTIFDKNKITILDDCAEMHIYNKNGVLTATTRIPVDKVEDVSKYKWGLRDKDGYIRNKNIGYLHKFIMGCNDENIFIDHIDRDPLNNLYSNLRRATPQENSYNRKVAKDNKSGVTGVFFVERREKWCSQLSKKFLGYFDNKKDAITARLKAERKHFGEFAPQQHLFEEYGIGVEEDCVRC